MNSERIHRYLIAASVFSTGNPYVDDFLGGGFNKENLVLVAAKTGTGKTFFGVQLASSAARQNKNVHYFALEAERFEIERRRLYYAISRCVYENYKEMKMPDYVDWLLMNSSSQWEVIEDYARGEIELSESTLTVHYVTGVYTPDMFEVDIQDLLRSPDKPDLVIVDHLHHFFLSGDEIESLKTVIHKFKKLKEDLEIPVVILAQLRKGDGNKGKRTLPFIEDIRGTASLSDVVTDVLIISKVPESKADEIDRSINMPMYFHFAKSRIAGSRTTYAGIVGFDYKTGTYRQSYFLTRTSMNDDPELVKRSPQTAWAKRAEFLVTPLLNSARKDYRTLND